MSIRAVHGGQRHSANPILLELSSPDADMKGLRRQMCAHRAYGLMGQILGDFGDDGSIQRARQCLAQHAQEAWLSHHDQPIETISLTCLLEVTGYLLGENIASRLRGCCSAPVL